MFVAYTIAPGMWWWTRWDCEIFVGERGGPVC